MMKIIHIGIIIIYIILLFVAIWELVTHYICDLNDCSVFHHAFQKIGNKSQVIYLLDNLCEESLWIFAFITSSIVSFLIFSILPLDFLFSYFAIVFLITFISFYCIMAFLVYHYVTPIKKYIIDYILKN